MPFDTQQFLSAGFTPRTKDIPVPDLAEFFPEGEKPVWKVRGLKGKEVAEAAEALQKYRNLNALMDKFLGGSDAEKIQAMAKSMGYDGDTPSDLVKRLEYLRIGSIEPIVDRDLASRFCEFFPIEFYQITNEILTLTGKGHVPGKQKPSGEITESTQA